MNDKRIRHALEGVYITEDMETPTVCDERDGFYEAYGDQYKWTSLLDYIGDADAKAALETVKRIRPYCAVIADSAMSYAARLLREVAANA